MKIVYLHQYFVHPDAAGGTRSYEFARRLVKRGHQVTLVTSSAMLPDVNDDGPIVRRQLDGIELVVLPIAYDNTMSYRDRIRAFVRFASQASTVAARETADVVFATSTPLTIAIPGLAARLATRAPMVFEVRDLWPELPIAMGALKSIWSRRAARGLEWAAYHGAAHVVALSPGMADGVIRRGIDPRRVTTIPNGCDIGLFTPDPAEVATFRAQSFPELRPDQPLIVYGGTYGAINDVGWLIDVAAAMRSIAPNIRFALVGKGAQAHDLVAKARAHGVLDVNLWMRPALPKSSMPLLLGVATVATSLFLPLKPMEHNSANKFFDGLAAGKPIAINYGGWQAELLKRHEAGIQLPQADPSLAAQHLRDLVEDKPRLVKMGQAARDLAKSAFDRDALAARLERVFFEVVGDRTRVRAA